MNHDLFSPFEISAIGEISNISLGSSATAISSMLGHRVEITTPEVSVVNAEDFQLDGIEPAIGVEIKYVSGLEGSNIMLLKLCDVKVIIDILMGTETPEEDFVLDELTLSAVCEVMNTMMGAASTALSDLFGKVVNISTPETFELHDLEEIKQKRLPVSHGPIVVVRFKLDIEPDLQSEFMNVMSVELARELIAGSGGDQPEESAAAAVPEPAPTVQPAKQPEPMAAGGPVSAASGGTPSQAGTGQMMAGAASAPASVAAGGSPPQREMENSMAQQAARQAMAPGVGTMGQPPQMAAAPQGMSPMPQAGAQQPPYPYYYMPPYGWPGYPPAAPAKPAAAKKPDPKVISTQPPAMPKLANGEELGKEQAQNLDLIMSVPLEVTVEIGRTRKKVQDILSFSKGSLIVLDRLAGDQVDLFVNGKCIARGEVVVIDDNFGIRIGEILHKPELREMALL